MTRINCGIPPKELTNKHLLAEHREIKRIPNVIKSGKANLDGIPEKFTLGKGHVKFFYNKLLYLKNRYDQLYEECKSREFNISYFGDAFDNLPENLFNDYSPTEEDREIIRQRISDRLNGVKE